ncbi:hypothetical protein G6F70_001957 [Rhizopus microsporus]|nr:hypothetical protein G6F71_002103 [Rhizopus microsporus]KAG1202757.1 hypothetical protein G6F70_001957 [Rhizopus microsporus]KAG1214361.1 hypothetical protein G6F69_001970 [Rhizopus microsporus]KAG1236917.1 hypothetical protein G6F67_001583 [Rhizopus microsporus]KAG1267368.1 hypothetical protein G6F68_001971 [Rhizopus microsporus]
MDRTCNNNNAKHNIITQHFDSRSQAYERKGLIQGNQIQDIKEGVVMNKDNQIQSDKEGNILVNKDNPNDQIQQKTKSKRRNTVFTSKKTILRKKSYFEEPLDTLQWTNRRAFKKHGVVDAKVLSPRSGQHSKLNKTNKTALVLSVKRIPKESLDYHQILLL